MSVATRQYATFYLDKEYLGVDVLRVQEVLRSQAMTSVPRAPHYIAGLINLRGQIVTAVDLRPRLGMPDRNPENEPMNVIVTTSEGPVSLLVDEIGDVLEVYSNSLESPPDTLQGPVLNYVQGIHKLPNRLLAVLDVDRLALGSEEAK